MMDEGKQFSLRWEKHAVNLASEAECFFQDEAFLDCSLFAEGQCLQAHKLILSAASPYLATLLRSAADKHPILIFNDIKYEELKGIVAFIYNGCVSVPESNMGAFLNAAQALLVRGLTHASKQWQSDLTVETTRRNSHLKRTTKPSAFKRGPGAPLAEEISPLVMRAPPVAVAPMSSSAEENAYKLQEVSMSNYLPSPRRYTKPVAQSPNFVMSSWKLGSMNIEEKNGHRQSEENSDAPPAHMFKKFRLEKPPPPVEEEKPAPVVKQEIEESPEPENEMELVEPKIELTEDDCTSNDSREPFYNPPDETPVPLLVCRTSLHEENDGNWSGPNTSPDHAQLESGQEMPCHTCHKRYKSRYALNRHILYECGKARKSFSCDECGKKVTRQDTLQKHKLIHLVQHMKEKDETL